MHPASSRASRKNVFLQIGPLKIPVDVYGGTYTPPSATSACIGVMGHEHEPTKVANHKVCSICQSNPEMDLSIGYIKSARAGSDGKLAVITDTDAANALEAAAEHRDVMPVVKTSRQVYEASVLESSEVYWLAHGEGASEELYAGLVAAITAAGEDSVFVTRWSPQKNVNLYRIVARHGLLGMIKLKPVSGLRAAPIEPPALSAGAQEMATLALGMVPEIGSDAVAELSENPYAQILATAADKALEAGRGAVRMSNQNRNTFGDNLAAASLAAMLEGADL